MKMMDKILRGHDQRYQPNANIRKTFYFKWNNFTFITGKWFSFPIIMNNFLIELN